MKNIVLLIAVVGSVVFSEGMALASDTGSASPAEKPGDQMSHAFAAHQSVNPNEAPSRANDKSKIAQPHNGPLAPSLPKSSLPINAGRQRGAASIGGAKPGNVAKNGVINGTEIKRRP